MDDFLGTKLPKKWVWFMLETLSMQLRLFIFILLFSPWVHRLHADPAPVMPFEYRDGLIWVKLESAGCALNFVLDSGAGSSLLSLETVTRLGLKLGSAQRVQAVSSPAVAWRVKGFKADGVSLRHEPLAMDLQRVSQVCCRPIDGVIGQEFFRGRIVQIDYKAHCLRFLDKPGTTCGDVANLPLKWHPDSFCVPVSVEGTRPRWVRLDTGCDVGLHWVVGSPKSESKKSDSLAFSHAKKSAELVTVQLGDEKIERVKTVFHQNPIFPGESGLLGNGILSKYRVTVDSISNRVMFDK